MNPTIDTRILSSLEKVFLDNAPAERPLTLQGFRNEIISFQLAFRQDIPGQHEVQLQLDSPLSRFVQLRRVQQVPVQMAMYDDCTDPLLQDGHPGLYPDLLTELKPHALKSSRQWSCIWVDVFAEDESLSGVFPLTLQLLDEQGMLLAERVVHIELLPASLPPQRLLLTRWFHCDCIAQHYGVEAFSEAHWTLIERFLRTAVRHGMNLVLTPIHTPPLDTAVGGERLTTQLVDVFLDGSTYHFNMDKLRRWIKMCKDCGVTHFEPAHLYTQWGAQHAPKIMATVNGEYGQLFGWDTPAVCSAYRTFLAAYIPALRQVFADEGVSDHVRWHISDEPSDRHLSSYLAARNQVDDLLQGCVIMDALSNFSYYQQGIVNHPVVATNRVEPFLSAQTPGLWVYYCCAQYQQMSNTFIALPSSRNRILGAQLFRWNAEGFLHWGYNFYNCMYSHYAVDPHAVTDADCGVPAGDPFQVYPGPDGFPEESLRLMVTTHALQDMRALEFLSSLTSREYVVHLLDTAFGGRLTFSTMAASHDILQLRQRVNQEILTRL
ncbi:MAG: DUF4091 domain-containing protein [Clostridia bacterium]|nr:DUF4091 domain-containing protein [Clostridia bacterium]